MTRNEDILGNIDVSDKIQEEIQDIPLFFNEVEEDTQDPLKNYEILELHSQERDSSIGRKSFRGFIFLVKYFSTSVCIFGVLLLVTNYSAYWNVVHSIIYAEELEHTKKSLIESVAAASISEKDGEGKDVNTFKQLGKEEESTEESHDDMHSMSQLIAKTNTHNINLGIEITPYENRIVIPKIGKNIPLIDITQTQVSGINELNNIFMDELENGVIRYPGSAKPGEDGNTFIFGHSSNFPWMEGEYNDVFSLLDKVVFDDEIVVYYGQEKYTYKIRTKDVIRPGDVSVLKSDDNNRSKITLMTCWPIGTTLNRLVLTGDLIKITQ